ncbi:Nn.00g028560.m01.CDS01 [Neocucurbitaria sp. VM-36]
MAATDRSIRTVIEDDRSVADVDTLSLIHVEPIVSNADLYAMTPPAYTQSIAENEVSVDAEAVRQGKPEAFERSPERDLPSNYPLQQHMSNASSSRDASQQQEREAGQESQARGNTPQATSVSNPVLGHYLTEPVTTANLVGVRACSILHDRPAIWLMKRKKMALSPLAAAVLTKEGLIRAKDLELISQHSGTRRDPTDPLSGILLGFYDTVGEIMLGLVAGPVELGKQASPMLVRYESRQKANYDGHTVPVTTGDVKGVPHAAVKVAIGTGKGMGRIVTATLKGPVLIMNGVTRGFHNLPKAYGEEVREYENITDLRSGLLVSAKSFGHGLGDGLSDLLAKPIEGAEKNGIIGLGTGMAKGLGNAMFKPAAGACGLIGYSSVGVYKSIRNIKTRKQDDPANLVRQLGEVEYAQANDADKLYIVRVWCQTQMRVRLA